MIAALVATFGPQLTELHAVYTAFRAHFGRK